MDLPSRGQSETVGIVLLTTVVVVTVSVGGAIVLVDAGSQAEQEPMVDAESAVTAGEIVLRHNGGDGVSASDIAVTVTGPESEQLSLGDDLSLAGSGDDSRFQAGDVWKGSHGLTHGTGRLVLVHEPTNTVIHERAFDIEPIQESMTLTVDGEATDVAVDEGETVPYTVTATLTDGSVEDVTDSVDAIDVTGSGDVSIDESLNELTGETTGDVTVTATRDDDSDSVDVTVRDPVAFDVAITDEPDAVTEGETATIVATVENTGTREATQTIGFSVDGSVEGQKQRTLSPGDSEELSFEYVTETGDAEEIAVDIESDSDDASTTVDVNYDVFFDVTVDDARTDDSIFEDETADVVVDVENIGEEDGTQTVTFLVDGNEELTRDLSVDSKTAVDETFTYDAQAGDAPAIDIAVVPDRGDSSTTTISVDEPAFFTAAIDGATDNRTITGNEIQFVATVENVGDREETRTLNYSFDGSVENSTDETLAGGESTTVTFSHTVPFGVDTGNYTHSIDTGDEQNGTDIRVFEPGWFSGEVTTGLGDQIAGTDVTFDADARVGQDFTRTVTTEPDDGTYGNYELTDIVPGEYVIRADADRYEASDPEVITVVADEGTEFVDFQLTDVTVWASGDLEDGGLFGADELVVEFDVQTKEGSQIPIRVDIEDGLGQTQEVKIDGETYTLTDSATDTLTGDGYIDLLNESSYTDAGTGAFDDIREQTTTGSATDPDPVSADTGFLSVEIAESVEFEDSPQFEVTSLDSPVAAEPSETITVNASVQNTGAGDTQKINYSFDGTVEETTERTYSPGEGERVEFTFTVPNDTSLGEYTHSIASEDDEATTGIAVVDPDQTGRFSGQVTSETGDPIAETTVTLVGDLQRTVETDANGEYTVSPVVPGEYEMTADAAGYESSGSVTVDVEANAETENVDFSLPDVTVWARGEDDGSFAGYELEGEILVGTEEGETFGIETWANFFGIGGSEQRVTINGQSYELTESADEDLRSNEWVDLLDHENYQDASDGEFAEIRERVTDDLNENALTVTLDAGETLEATVSEDSP